MFGWFKKNGSSDQAYDGYTPSQADQKLASMNPRVTDDTREDKLIAAWDAISDSYRERPVNTVCMVVAAVLVLAIVLYGASYIAPITDPAR